MAKSTNYIHHFLWLNPRCFLQRIPPIDGAMPKGNPSGKQRLCDIENGGFSH